MCSMPHGDGKCESCNRNMHVFCSVFPTTDGVGTIVCLNCTYVNGSDADDNAGTGTAAAKSARKRKQDKENKKPEENKENMYFLQEVSNQ